MVKLRIDWYIWEGLGASLNYMFTKCSLYVHYLFIKYSQYVHYMFTISTWSEFKLVTMKWKLIFNGNTYEIFQQYPFWNNEGTQVSKGVWIRVISAGADALCEGMLVLIFSNNKKRSHTQLDSRKQVIAFQDRVMTTNIKEAKHPLKREKQVIDKSSIMLKISTKSMHRVLVWEIGPANNTTRCSRLSKRRLIHAWHPSQLAINLSIDKSKWQIHVNNKSNKITRATLQAHFLSLK